MNKQNILPGLFFIAFVILMSFFWTNPKYWDYRQKRDEERVKMLRAVFTGQN